MYMQAFGEVLTDVLTTNPALVDIPSASAILDTSNYTFQAVTFGKDSQGFQYHAHSVSTTEFTLPGVVYNDGRILVQTFDTGSSSYAISATHTNSELPLYVSSLPSSPFITDTRLERGPTNTLATSPNLGHYSNTAIGSDFDTSGQWNLAGSFPPSGTIGEYSFLDPDGIQMFSGTLSSFYNDRGLADVDGHVTISNTTQTDLFQQYFEDGSYVLSGVNTVSGKMSVYSQLAFGDAAALAAFGGIMHIGVYCLDLKAMLADGLTPPYDWNALDTTRRYKLVAKKTFTDNLLFHTDRDETALAVFGAIDNSGFQHILNENRVIAPVVASTRHFSYNGPVFGLTFVFT